MKLVKILIIVFLILYIYSFCYFNYGLKNDKIYFNKIEAIVVLSGEKGRIPLAKKIFLKNKNIYLIISGANSNLKKEFIKKIFGLRKFKNIIIENSSQNTIENALEVKKILKKLKIHKILLITSAIHMPRALIIFNFILGKNFKIYRKSLKEKFKIFKVLKENIKLFYFLVLYFLKFC